MCDHTNLAGIIHGIFRSISQIEDHIKKLDAEYEKVNELKSKGEVDGFNPRPG